MTRDLFRRYVWLVDTVKNGKKMTFDEISRAWDISAFNVDHSKLALRTFHNHREAIDNLFGIKILCDRSDHHYYIPGHTDQSTNLKLWMLQSLSFDHLVREEGKDVESRMVFDQTPEQKFGLISIVDAMKRSVTVSFTYRAEGKERETEVEIEPYAVRFCDNSWSVLGKKTSTGEMKNYLLPRMSNIELTDTRFKFPHGFSASAYFNKFVGHQIADDKPMESITVKVNEKIRDGLKGFPLHKSQRETESHGEFSIFEMEAVPTDELIEKLLILGPDLEVLSPQSLRDKINERLKEISCLYQHAE